MAFDPQLVKFGVAALVAYLVITALLKRSSGYAPIGAQYINTTDIKNLDHSLACVVGPGESSGYYSKGLTPGGLCGDQKLIREQMRGYKILSGVGGSLLEK
jgi:hypothetical protein